MKILVQKFGGTSVDSDEHRQKAAGKIVRAVQAGWNVVVVVSAIGRAGAPYATDTLVSTLKNVDPNVPPAPREMDLLMACGEIISTVVLAQALRGKGYDTVALTGGQAGILTDYEFGNARILSIDPAYIVRMLDVGKIVLVAGFQGVTSYGAITTLGRGGSDTTASALGAALKPHADEVVVEIYTDVDGVKTADPRLVPEARHLATATYEEVAEMAHMGAKVVHPRAAEIAHQYGIPLWVKSTFTDTPGTQITGRLDEIHTTETSGQTKRLSNVFSSGFQVTGVTHTGKIVYLCFSLPEMPDENEMIADKAQLELVLYKILQKENMPLYLNSTDGNAFAFAVHRDHLPRLRNILDGLVIPVDTGRKKTVSNGGNTVQNRVYLLGLSEKDPGFVAQQTLLAAVPEYLQVRTVKAEVTENCTVVSVIAARFQGLSGIMARMLETLAKENVPVFQTADSELSISVLIPEADVAKATRALHAAFAPEMS